MPGALLLCDNDVRSGPPSWCFPDLRPTIDGIIATGDRVASRITRTGTNTGELFGQPTTGKSNCWDITSYPAAAYRRCATTLGPNTFRATAETPRERSSVRRS